MRKTEWRIHNKTADFIGIGKKIGVDPVAVRVARNRGVETEEDFDRYFNPSLEELNDGALLKDMAKAVDIIKSKIATEKKMMVIGDYDIDGVCATTILVKGLRELGGICDYIVPHRIEDGYGLNAGLVDKSIEAGCDTIITCDNGIAASAEIAYAKERGMTVVVTDHHEVPLVWDGDISTEKLPPADAIIDPKQADCKYPFGGICGAVVAWKFIIELMKSYGKTSEAWMQYLDFAAFATIGDVMELKDENRSIVAHGMVAIQNSENNGIRALINQCGLANKTIQSYHIGFVLGPCLNATGRLDTAMRGVDLFMAEDYESAVPIAQELVNLNDERKNMTLTAVELAKSTVEDKNMLADPILVVYLPGVHESIAGIVAGRLRETYYRPTFVLTDGENCVKGSGRSTDEFSMFEQMSKISDVFLKFGGHPKAAGLSIEADRIDEFRKRINENCGITVDDLVEKVYVDARLELDYISYSLIEDLKRVEPCGNGNTKPQFGISGVRAKRLKRFGKEGQWISITLVLNNGLYMEAKYWGDADEFIAFYEEKFSPEEMAKLMNGQESAVRFSFIYYPEINDYRDSQSLEIVVKNYQ